jgi:hypothetical protein
MRYAILLLVLIAGLAGNAQTENIAARKYAINFPERWSGNAKLLFKITSILEANVPELQGKQECLDCDAEHWVNFYLFNASVERIYHKIGTSEFNTDYTFYCFMDVYGKNNVLIRRIIISDTNELRTFAYRDGKIPVNTNNINDIKQSNALQVRMASPEYNSVNINNDLSTLNRLNEGNAANTFNPQDYIKKNKTKMVPSIDYLWDEAEKILKGYKLKG